MATTPPPPATAIAAASRSSTFFTAAFQPACSAAAKISTMRTASDIDDTPSGRRALPAAYREAERGTPGPAPRQGGPLAAARLHHGRAAEICL